MSYLLVASFVGMVLGMSGVAATSSPYFAALGLILVAVMGCIGLATMGGCFLSLVLLLVYLGGMLVVFAYSAALAAEPYPEGFLEWGNLVGVGSYFGGFLVLGLSLVDEEAKLLGDEGRGVLRGNIQGAGEMYGEGYYFLLLAGGMLLLTLFVVFEMTRGLGVGTVRV